MQLYRIFFSYGDHEMENELFAHGSEPRPSIADAREYLLKMYGNDYMDQPELLKVDGVYNFDTVHDKDGNPYKVEVKL